MSAEDRGTAQGSTSLESKRTKHEARAQSAQMSPEVMVWSGSKGGTGRSSIVALVAIALAERGYKTLAIDLDLSSSNLHTLLGAGAPPQSLERWLIEETDDLESLSYLVPNTSGLKLLSAASSIIHLADISPERIKALISRAQRFEVDYVLIDLGAAYSVHHIDLLNMAHHSFCVTTPEPTSIESVYTLYKSLLMRSAESSSRAHPWLKKILKRVAQVPRAQQTQTFGETLGMIRELDLEVHREVREALEGLHCELILNRALPDDEARVITALSGICRASLAIELKHTLTLPEDEQLISHIRGLKPLQGLPDDSSLKLEVARWVDDWLLKQPYRQRDEESLETLGQRPLLTPLPRAAAHQPQLKSSMGLSSTYSAEVTPEELTRDLAQDLARDLSADLAQALSSESAGASDRLMAAELTELIKRGVTLDPSLALTTAPAQLETPAPLPSEFRPLEPLEVTPNYHEHGPFVEPQFIPAPVMQVEMEDPPRHEVTSIEEEVKTPDGWCHLKTSDLAPFRPAIQTSIYRSGDREVFFEESYRGIYETEEGTMLEKRVERIHHESAQLLSRGGVEAWREAHAMAL